MVDLKKLMQREDPYTLMCTSFCLETMQKDCSGCMCKLKCLVKNVYAELDLFSALLRRCGTEILPEQISPTLIQLINFTMQGGLK